MLVFLTSSPTGPLDGSRKVDGLDKKNNFVEHLRKYWKPNAKNLMITATPDCFAQNDEMISFFEGAVKKDGFTCQPFEVWDERTVDFSKEKLHSYDVIWLGGGHVPTQNHFFEEISLREKMEGFSGIVIGISAGTMNAADVVYAQPEHEGEAMDSEFKRYLKGLNLTKTQILPHYQMVKNWYLDGMRLFEDITYGDSWGKKFLALEDGSYLMIQHGRETVHGNAYEISNGQIRKICEDEE